MSELTKTKSKTKSKTILKKGESYYWMGKNKTNMKKMSKKEWDKVRNGRQPIPPAYKNVVITPFHPKEWARGIDEAGRTQVLYQPKFRQNREQLKFKDLVAFGKKWPAILKQVKQDAKNGNPVAVCILLMIECSFRVGSSGGVKEHIGASELNIKHTKLKSKSKSQSKSNTKLKTKSNTNNQIKNNGNSIHIGFKGKKGVWNECVARSPEIVAYFKKLYKDPNLSKNRPVFCDGTRKIRAEDINQYLSKWGPFTSKYIRTWTANISLLQKLSTAENWKEYINSTNERQRVKLINKIVDEIAIQHHHTRAICKKSYISPELLNVIKMKKLPKTFNKTNSQSWLVSFLNS